MTVLNKDKAKNAVTVPVDEVEMSITLTNEQAMQVAQQQAEAKGYLNEFKFTYQMSNQFAEGICKIGQMFCDGINLENEIDIWVPTLAYQAICMDGPAKKFYGKVIFPYSEANYHTTKKYLDLKLKFKDRSAKDFKEGNLFLFYLPEYDKFCSAFFSGTLVNAGNKLFNLLLSGKGNYIRLKSNEIAGKRYLNVTVESIAPFAKPKVNMDRLDKAIELLMLDTREETDSSETESAGGR